MKYNGNIVPPASGHTEGIVVGNAYYPTVEVHMESGVFHNVGGTAQSGVIRFDPYTNGMEYSNDGGASFTAFSAGGGVTSIGVLGGANLTGAVDLASVASGFVSITDNGGSSPIYIGVDTLALSGLWGFPTNGFSNVMRGYSNTYVAAESWTISHNLGTENVIVSLYDDTGNPLEIMADDIEITDTNTVTITFNSTQAGKAVVTGF